MLKHFQFLALFVLLLGASLESKSAMKDSVSNPKVFLNAGTQYISNLTYAGRKDFSSVPVLLPNLNIISEKGFFIGSAGYINAASNSFAAEGLSVTPGYVFSLDKKKKFGGALSATKYFFRDSSSIILSAFDATTDATVYYQPKSFKVSLSASYQFGKNQNDLVNTLEFLKDIKLAKNLKISPTVSLLAGTQSFFQTYYSQTTRQRKITNPGGTTPSPIPFLPGSTQAPTESIITETVTEEQQKEIRKYQLLAVNATVPLNYSIKKLQLNFTPYFIKPLNQVQNFDGTESGKLFFLFNTGISYTF